MYILFTDKNGRHLIIDKLRNNNVILYSKIGSTVLPLVKCSLLRLSFVFSFPNDVMDSQAKKIDHHSTENVIRYVLGDTDSRNCKLYKPNGMMYSTFGVLMANGKYILRFSVYYNIWKNKNNGIGNNTYDDMITTEKVITEFELTAKDFIKVLTHINIFNKSIADAIINESLSE